MARPASRAFWLVLVAISARGHAPHPRGEQCSARPVTTIRRRCAIIVRAILDCAQTNLAPHTWGAGWSGLGVDSFNGPARMGETRERYSTHALNLLLGRKGRANPQGCWLQARKPRDRGKLYGAPSAGPSTVGHWTWAHTRLTLHRAPLICTCAAAAACCEGFVSVGRRSGRQLPPGDSRCPARDARSWCLMRRTSGGIPRSPGVARH